MLKTLPEGAIIDAYVDVSKRMIQKSLNLFNPGHWMGFGIGI